MARNIEELEIEVYGRVQGVNFRSSVKSFADTLGLKGYVVNRQDGGVLIVVQGKTEELEKILKWIKKGPVLSKVDRVIENRKNVKALYEGFEIIKEDNFFVDQAKSFLNLGKSLIIDNSGSKVPLHIAVIPDGNRRWAREKGLYASFGHYTAGSKDHVISLLREAKNLGVRYFTIWGFSTENWNRNKNEIKAIFDLVLKNIGLFREEAHKNMIRFRHLGRKDRLPKDILNALNKLEKETENYKDFNVQLCLDYGGRDELIRAVNRILKSGAKKIDDNFFREYLDSRGVPDPDLIIRTSGEKRISGFMPFQSAYSELYFSDVYFPDFDVHELRNAVKSFGKRIRRFGGTAKEDLVSKR